MNKKDMINWLRNETEDWDGVYLLFTDPPEEFISKNGWYLAFDGPSIEEMFLTDEHPLGDKSGNVITITDFADT